jgi:hypothetical protein
MYKLRTGSRFGKLVVLKKASRPSGRNKELFWECQCDCGRVLEVRSYSLRKRGTQSCGCYREECKFITHGLTEHPLYGTWGGMKHRCFNQNDKRYSRYGGRGITVESCWKNDPEAFVEWSLANGWQEGLQIDRINNDGNYSPENCRWTNRKVQSRNYSRNKMYWYQDKLLCLQDIWDKGSPVVSRQTLARRLKKGWSVEKALSTPTYTKGIMT